MADITTSDGKEYTVDLYQITLSEYESLFDNQKNELEKRALMARCYGLTSEQWQNMPLPDGAALQTMFWVRCRELFERPKNSASAST